MASPVIVFPGLDNAGTLFQPLIQSWKAQGRPVLLADLPNHNSWAEEKGSLQSLARLANDWLEQTGSAKADIVAESFGSVTAFTFLQLYPHRVESLSVLGGFAYMPTPALRLLFWSLYPIFYPLSLVLPTRLLHWLNQLFLPAVRPGDPRWLKDAARAMEAPPAQVLLAKIRMVFQCDARPLLPSLKVPVTIVHGTADQIIPFRAAVELSQAVPHARLIAIPGQGHLSFHARHDLLAYI